MAQRLYQPHVRTGGPLTELEDQRHFPASKLFRSVAMVEGHHRSGRSHTRLREEVALRHLALEMPDRVVVGNDQLAEILFQKVDFFLEVICKRSHMGRLPEHQLKGFDSCLPVVAIQVHELVTNGFTPCDIFVKSRCKPLVPRVAGNTDRDRNNLFHDSRRARFQLRGRTKRVFSTSLQVPRLVALSAAMKWTGNSPRLGPANCDLR